MGKMGKILKAIGVEAEDAPTEKEGDKKAREDKIILAWRWLRTQIDQGVAEYLQTGDRSKLQEYIGSPAIDALLPYLGDLQAKGLLWAQGGDMVRKEAKVEVVSAELNKQKQPTSFVIRERFNDYSVLSGPGGQQKSAPGTERVLQAKVEVKDGQHYKLLSVIQLRGESI